MNDAPAATTSATVLVTGATRGIGNAIATEFGRRGDRVLVHGRTRDSAERAAETLAEADVDAVPVYGDLLNAAEIGELITMVGATGSLDVIVNNAGLVASQTLRRADRDIWNQMFAIHVLAPVQICRGLFPLLRKSTRAAIVNVGSLAGDRPVPGRAAYSAAKAALANLTLSLAQEWAPDKIRSNVVLPGSIDTELLHGTLPNADAVEFVTREIGLKRLGTAEEVARVVCFLASPDASYCTGTIVPVHGGIR